MGDGEERRGGSGSVIPTPVYIAFALPGLLSETAPQSVSLLAVDDWKGGAGEINVLMLCAMRMLEVDVHLCKCE